MRFELYFFTRRCPAPTARNRVDADRSCSSQRPPSWPWRNLKFGQMIIPGQAGPCSSTSSSGEGSGRLGLVSCLSTASTGSRRCIASSCERGSRSRSTMAMRPDIRILLYVNILYNGGYCSAGLLFQEDQCIPWPYGHIELWSYCRSEYLDPLEKLVRPSLFDGARTGAER